MVIKACGLQAYDATPAFGGSEPPTPLYQTPTWLQIDYLERQVGAFVERYYNRRYHESLANLTPADI